MLNRRVFLLAVPLAACAAPAGPAPTPSAPGEPNPPFAPLEQRYGARLGVFAVNTATGRSIGYRQDERFALCSTYKTYAAAAALPTHPGTDILDACAAAVIKSDNAAANKILDALGGPAAITRFARSIGDQQTRLDRPEPDLNSAIPGDPRDTTTPSALGNGYRALVLADVLDTAERDQLKSWLISCTTGTQRIRAGLPTGCTTGDKTGTGDYGAANDVAVTWTDRDEPLVITVLSSKSGKDDEPDSALIADATRLVVSALT